MEYTISDIGTLRIYMYMWAVFVTLLFLAIVILSVIKIPFDLKPGKHSDVSQRRIVFFIGLALTITSVFFLQLNFVIDNLKARVLEDDMFVVIQALGQTIPATVLTSGTLYLILFAVVAMLTQQWIGYKPYSVLKSNNKWLGLF